MHLLWRWGGGGKEEGEEADVAGMKAAQVRLEGPRKPDWSFNLGPDQLALGSARC